MHWIFIICRENSIEQVKIFNDYWEGAKFTDNIIQRLEPKLSDLPAYNRGENYKNNNLTIGLYKGN